MLEIKKSTIQNIFFIIFYKIILEIIYVQYIVPTYGYSGFKNDFDIKFYVINWIILLLFLPLIVDLFNSSKPSNIVLLIFYLIGLIPGLVIQSFMPPNIIFALLFYLYWFLFGFYNKLIPNITFKLKINDSRPLYIITGFFFLIIIYISGKYTGFNMHFNLLDVYELRSQMSNYNIPLIFMYLFATAKVCLPIIFVYYISRSNIKLAVLVGFLQFLAFSVDGSKSTIFSIILAFIIYKFFKNISILIIPKLVFIFSFASLMEPLIFKSDNLILFVIRRLMFVPNLLHYYYYDFFSKNVKDYFAQGALGKFGLQSSYDEVIPNMIGSLYFGDSNLIANNGLFSDAYYNLGIFGIFIMPLLLILIFRFFDGCTEGLKPTIIITAVIVVAYTFISSSFFTVLLTHGFLFSCFVLFFMPKKGSKIEK